MKIEVEKELDASEIWELLTEKDVNTLKDYFYIKMRSSMAVSNSGQQRNSKGESGYNPPSPLSAVPRPCPLGYPAPSPQAASPLHYRP